MSQPTVSERRVKTKEVEGSDRKWLVQVVQVKSLLVKVLILNATWLKEEAETKKRKLKNGKRISTQLEIIL